MKIHIVAGTFNDNGGKPSGWAAKLATAINQEHNVIVNNGGKWDSLLGIFLGLSPGEMVVWLADVPNDKPKIVEQIKQRHPNIFLVTSKRNLDNKYSLQDLVARALSIKSNLFIEFTGDKNNVLSTILDPLGNAYAYKESNITRVAEVLTKRLRALRAFRRMGSLCLGDAITVPQSDEISEFMSIIKEQAEKFHIIIHGVNTERMLGNASFRCARGFPSFRTAAIDKQIFVSRRNIDKRSISPEEFVAVRWISNSWEDVGVGYYGPHKPSVDTPVQLKLYNRFYNVNYMLHSHTYIEGAPMTNDYIPCGAIEEVTQICETNDYDYDRTNFCVNVRGHGSIVFADKPSFLKDIKWISRPVPEIV